MKNIIVVIIAVIIAFVTTAYVKRNNYQSSASNERVGTKNKYCCPKCHYSSLEAGMCPKDNIPLIKVGTYYCENEYSKIGDKPGKCGDGKDMKKMEDPDRKVNQGEQNGLRDDKN